MSDSEQPASSDTEEQQAPQQKQSRPSQQLSRSDSETDPGYRSRSQSRRARRRKQQKGQQNPKENPMPALEENQDAEAQDSSMQPFEMIGPDETSMNGPVTYARAQRGEIPMREGNPEQQLATGPKGGGKEESSMMDQDGLKLRIELNLDIEIELKASIHGDITLALL
ncbi:hypothetical protein MMC08_000240 [Hypocenomyce scalaris]|nr:hypothetical protein [Hypocenomyce scalaris]